MNLPKDATYQIIDHFHTGGIENASQCDHCGKSIVRVAIIESESGDKSTVGFDCASTLTSDPWKLSEVEAFMSAVEQTKRKIAKAKKEDPAASVNVHEYEEGKGYFQEGGFLVSIGQRSVNHPKRFSKMIPLLAN